MESLRGLDAAFLAAETNTMPLNVGGILVFDRGRLSELESYDRILRLFAARIHLFPHFRKKVVSAPLGLVQPYWVDDDAFSLSNHIQLALSDEEVDMKAVLEFASQVIPQHLDRSKPLWMLYVIPRVKENRIVLIAKLHHAITDGISGMEALASMFDLNDDFDRNLKAAPYIPAPPPSQLEVAAKTFLDLGEHFVSAISAGIGTAKDLPNALVRAASEERINFANELVFKPRRSGSTGAISSTRRIISKSMDLEDISKVAKTGGVKVNDVLIALSHATLVSYLSQVDAPLPESLIAMIPVSIHGDSSDVQSKNKVSALFLSIPTAVEDIKELLSVVHEISDRAKSVHSAIGSTFFYNLAEMIPPVLLETAFRTATGSSMFNVAPPPFNYVVSNVPGPDVELYLAGNRLERVIPFAPVADGSGITFAYLSYRNSISLGLVVDPSLFPRSDDLSDILDKTVDALIYR